MKFLAKNGASGLLSGAIVVAGVAALAAPLAVGAANAQASNTDKGRQLFVDWSCGSCHVLADAGGAGHVGPVLDGDANLDKDFIVARVTNGQGAMPGFGGLMSDEEIAALADYLVVASKK